MRVVVGRVSIAGRGAETADINILIYDAISRRRSSQAYFEVWDIGGRYQTRHSVSYWDDNGDSADGSEK